MKFAPLVLLVASALLLKKKKKKKSYIWKGFFFSRLRTIYLVKIKIFLLKM